MADFSTLGLSATMLKSLRRLDFSNPTPIQSEAIPHAVEGKDVLGTAQTGTGKTAAFGLPLIDHIAHDPKGRQALVLTPTRELATQVQKAIESFIDKGQKIRTALLIGGEPYFRQLQALSKNPAIIIATPGRLNDHLDQGSVDLGKVSYLVLDETDRMLDMGFSVQIDRVLESVPSNRQTLLFSATLPPKIEGLAKTYLTDPVRVSMGSQSEPAKDVEQKTLFLSQGEKLDGLVKILNENEGSAIVFVRTKYGTERMAKSLVNQGFKAEALHGDLRQRKRDNVTRAFRSSKFRVLVATDVAARGLDIPHIALVINHDLPQVAEDYVHRIGRTARAGAKGLAFSFVSPAEKNLWSAITRLLNPKTSRAERDEDRPQSGRRGGFKDRWRSKNRDQIRSKDSDQREHKARGKPKRTASDKSRRAKQKGKAWNPLEMDKAPEAPKGKKPKKNKKPYSSEKDKGQSSKPKQRARDSAAKKNKGKPNWAGKGKSPRAE